MVPTKVDVNVRLEFCLSKDIELSVVILDIRFFPGHI